MKIKLNNTPSLSEALEVTSVMQSYAIADRNNEIQKTLQIVNNSTEPADFEKYVNFFSEGDFSVITLFNNKGEQILQVKGKTLESVTQNVKERETDIYVTINLV